MSECWSVIGGTLQHSMTGRLRASAVLSREVAKAIGFKFHVQLVSDTTL